MGSFESYLGQDYETRCEQIHIDFDNFFLHKAVCKEMNEFFLGVLCRP